MILCVGIGAAAEITVQPGDSIQAVVDNASSEDVITIQPGTYTENVKIDTDGLTIRSASGNPDNTMIKAKTTTNNAIFVQADNVRISGITAAAATGSGTSGICLSGCSNCIVENNKLASNGQGIYLVSSIGCTISGNTVINSRFYGILLGSAKSNIITGNTVTNSERGIYIGNSDENTVSGNTVTLNSVLGFYSCSLCDQNRIYNNYFNNTEISVKSGSGNSYNTTKTSGTNIIGGSYIGGNYWGKPDGTGFSDSAIDNDGDGISDSAYSLPGSSYLDYLPLVYPSSSPEPVHPVADFSSDVTSGEAPLEVSFTDKSTGNPTTWDWDFGDGNVSTDKNPVHIYTSAGTYTTTLTVSNADGAASKDGTITVTQASEPEPEPVPPVADFSSDVTSGEAPLDVSFTDKSTGTPTAWEWDFGDRTTSTDQNPVHTYTSAGAYTVTLTASNANGGSSKTGSITVLQTPELALPVADFGTNTIQGPAPLEVQFTDLSQNAFSWSWDFDSDGQPDSTDQNPVYVYEVPGDYTVKLTVSNENGTASKTFEIEVLEAEEDTGLPIADFSANVTSGYAPLEVLFTDLSQKATEIGWDFNNDGVADMSSSPVVYGYTSPGTYNVNLFATNENGTVSKTLEIEVLKEKSSGGSSHSSGGGGGGSPEPAKNVEVKELSQVFITNGKAVKFDFAKNATCVVYVSFDAKKTAGKTTTIVEQLKSKSALVSELPSDEVYKSFNVWVGNGGYATQKNIENPVLCFKVEKSWMQNKSIDRDSITLNKYEEKNWGQLTTNLTGEDDKYLYFTTDVPGFSSFAITGTTIQQIEEESKQIPAEERSFGDVQSEKNETEEPESEGNSSNRNILLSVGIVIGALGLVGLVLKSMKK